MSELNEAPDTIDPDKKQGADPVYMAGLWRSELQRAQKYIDKWQQSADKIVKKYRDEETEASGDSPRYNVLWSNVQTLMPAVYAKAPKAVCQRRYLDRDPVGRIACQVLQRATQYQIDLGFLHNAVKQSVLERLLSGRGTLWVDYEPEISEKPVMGPDGAPMEDEDGETVTEEQIEHETVCVDYVDRKDFLHAPARTWEEVPWVARRTYPTRKQCVERFGDDIGKRIPLIMEPEANDEAKNVSAQYDELLRASMWEIWYKPEKKVYWVADQFDTVCDTRDDPLNLHAFFPCPKPLYATLTNDKLIPVPDYKQYQAQASEMADLTQRIDRLIAACQVKGVYDGSQPNIERLVTESRENDLIPVENWASFSQAGGLKGSVDFMPVDMFSKVLQELYQARREVKADIYEITGISDIIRGQGQASETATAQRIKGQFATLRLKDLQDEVARFVRDTVRIVAELIAEQFQPETIEQMSSAAEMEGAQKMLPVMGPDGRPVIDPQTGQPKEAMQFDKQTFMQALQMLKDERMRGFRIDIETDSTISPDEQAEQQARVQFLGAVGQFMSSALPAIQQYPGFAPLLGKMMLFGVRGFRAGRELEGAFEDAIQKLEGQSMQPKPDPKTEQMQQKMQMERENHQMDMQAKAADTQATVIRAKAEVQTAAIKHHLDVNKMAAQAQVQPLQPITPPLGMGQPQMPPGGMPPQGMP